MIEVAQELLSVVPDMGAPEAGKLFEQFAIEGNAELDTLRTNIISPESKKKARTWGLAEAAAMIGRSMNSLRTHDSDIGRDETGKWAFTLDEINLLRDKYGTRYVRPAGSKAMILAISNFKGGVAKTTTCVHLAQKAAIEGLRVLVVDLDPQASTTFNLGPFIPDIELGSDDIINAALLEDPKKIKQVVVRSYFPGISLVPANLHLQELDIMLPYEAQKQSAELGHPAFRLQNALELIREKFDLIILDCGPNMASVSVNAMAACNGLIVPCPPSTYDHASFVMLCSALSHLFSSMGKELDYLRVLITKHPGSQSKGANVVEQRIRKLYGDYVLANVMNLTSEIEKASAEMSTVYDQAAGKNNRRTYQRAIDILDSVNNEILEDIKLIWAAEAKKASESNSEVDQS